MSEDNHSGSVRVAERLCIVIESTLTAVGWLSWISVIALIFVTLFDVISRRFFPVNSIGLQEAEWHLHTILFCCVIGLALSRNKHVRVDVLSSLLSSRKRMIVEIFGLAFLLFPVIGVLLWGSIQIVEQSWMFKERSSNSGGLPYRYVIKAFLPLCFGLIILAGISSLIRNILELRALSNSSSGPVDAEKSEASS